MRSRLDRRVLLVALALVVFAPGLDWGIPHATGPERVHGWGNDDALPLSALSEMHATFVEPGEQRNVGYPWFYFALHAGVYAPTMGALWLAGDLERPSARFPFGLRDPVRAVWLLDFQSRLLHLLLAVVLILAIEDAARALAGRTAGLCAGLSALSAFPLAYYVRVGNPDLPALAFTALGLAVVARSLAEGLSARRGTWLGVWVALAATTKDQAGASFVLAVPALFAVHLAGQRRVLGRRATWTPLLAAALGLLGTFLVASGALVDPDRLRAHLELLLRAAEGGELDLARHAASAAGVRAQLGDLVGHLKDVMGPGLFGVALASVGLAVWQDRRLFVFVLASAGFFALLVPVGFSLIHYLLPVALPLYVVVGFGWARAAALLFGARGERVAIAAAVLLAAFASLRTLDLTHAMLTDSRYAAGEWLEAAMQPGDRLLYFGPPMRLPHLRADVATLAVQQEADRVLVERERPEFVYVTPDESAAGRRRVEWRRGGYAIFNWFVGPELWERLVDGRAGYRLVARFQSPRLLPWIDRPALSYPAVNPPIHLFVREDLAAGRPRLEPWAAPPHAPGPRPIHEPSWPEVPARQPGAPEPGATGPS